MLGAIDSRMATNALNTAYQRRSAFPSTLASAPPWTMRPRATEQTVTDGKNMLSDAALMQPMNAGASQAAMSLGETEPAALVAYLIAVRDSLPAVLFDPAG